jgi:hypothetical protein
MEDSKSSWKIFKEAMRIETELLDGEVESTRRQESIAKMNAVG